MPFLPAFKSKRYLQRIWLTVTMLTVILLLVASVSITYMSERTVLRVQQNASEKVMGQIRYNVQQMNSIVNDAAQTLFLNDDVKVLRYSKGGDDLLYQRINALDTYVGTTSFLQSVFIYNRRLDRFFIGNGNVRSVAKPYEQKFRSLLAGGGEPLKLRLIPVDLDRTGTDFRKIDFFTYMMYDATNGDQPDDVLILNVKSEWLFDNLELIAHDEGKQTGEAYLMDDQGRILNANRRVETAVPELTGAVMPELRKGAASGYLIATIDGRKQVVSYMQAGMQDWTIIHTQPYSEVVSQVQQLRYTVLLLTAAFLVLAVLAGVVLSRRIYRPFEQLVHTVVSSAPRDMYDGTGEERSGGDEIALLSGLYGHMLDRVKTADTSMAENRWIVKRYTLRRLVQESRSLTAEQWAEEAAKSGLALTAEGPFMLCVARVDDAPVLFAGEDSGERKLIHYAISNIAEELLAPSFRVEVIDLKPDHLVFLLQRKEGEELAEPRSQEEAARIAEDTLREIQRIVRSYYRMTFSVSVSGEFADCRDLSAQYARTLERSVYKLFYGRESYVTEELVSGHIRSAETSIPTELERRLIEGIRSGGVELLDGVLDKFFERTRHMDYDSCMHALSYLTVIIKRTVAEVNENKMKPLSLDLYRLHAVITEQETLDNMKDVYRRVLHEIGSGREEDKDQDRNDMLIEAIKEIVDANFRDLNLSLQSISDILKMSSVYVGRLFRKAENLSVADYINEVRLQHTMLLLEKGNYSINEVMEDAGFSNQSHFFRLFKKKFGTTPREYRMKKILS